MPIIKYTSGAMMDGDDYIEVELHAHWEICQRCEGNGSHVNPAIDGNGLTQSDIDELDDGFMERYTSGFYDVVCEYCEGKGRQLIADELDENHEFYDSYLDWKSDYDYGTFIHSRNEKARAGYNFDIRDDYWI